MESIKKILKFGMRLEKQGETFYEYYVDHVNDHKTKELFRKLANLEKEHYELLEKKYNELNKKEDLKVISWVVDNNETFNSPMIFNEASNLASTTNMDMEISDLAIMRMAYLIETDFREFYKNAAEHVTNEEVKNFLLQLADWEDGHKELFYNEYKKLLKDNWKDMESYLALND